MEINREELKRRFDLGAGVLTQLPGVVEDYKYLKSERSQKFHLLPISKRFESRISIVASTLTDLFPGVDIFCTTERGAFIDSHTESEEFVFWKAKQEKKTWSGIYPNEFKLSDIDINLFRNGVSLDIFQINSVIKTHPTNIKNTNLFVLRDLDSVEFKVDIYPYKKEDKFQLWR